MKKTIWGILELIGFIAFIVICFSYKSVGDFVFFGIVMPIFSILFIVTLSGPTYVKYLIILANKLLRFRAKILRFIHMTAEQELGEGALHLDTPTFVTIGISPQPSGEMVHELDSDKILAPVDEFSPKSKEEMAKEARRLGIQRQKERKEEEIYVPELIKAAIHISDLCKESMQGSNRQPTIWNDKFKAILKTFPEVPDRFQGPLKQTMSKLYPECFAGGGDHKPSEGQNEKGDLSE
jgi:hypothetical protein